MVAEIHIVGVLVQALPEHGDAIADAVSALPNAEVRALSGAGKLVVVCECASADETLALIARIRDLPGVADVALVYQHVESAAALDEEISDEDDAPRVH